MSGRSPWLQAGAHRPCERVQSPPAGRSLLPCPFCPCCSTLPHVQCVLDGVPQVRDQLDEVVPHLCHITTHQQQQQQHQLHSAPAAAADGAAGPSAVALSALRGPGGAAAAAGPGMDMVAFVAAHVRPVWGERAGCRTRLIAAHAGVVEGPCPGLRDVVLAGQAWSAGRGWGVRRALGCAKPTTAHQQTHAACLWRRRRACMPLALGGGTTVVSCQGVQHHALPTAVLASAPCPHPVHAARSRVCAHTGPHPRPAGAPDCWLSPLVELLEKAYGGRDEGGINEMEFARKW